MKIAILGGGAMGSAFTVPLRDNGHAVALWGTEQDKEIIKKLARREPHPRIGIAVPQGVTCYYEEELEDAVGISDIVVIAVSSDVVKKIIQRVAHFIRKDTILMSAAKGLSEGLRRPVTMSEVISGEILTGLKIKLPIVSIGGPSVASELANRLPTSAVYASRDTRAAKICRQAFEMPYYKIQILDDVVGLEWCSALKNVYAIAVGWCRGIQEKRGIKQLDNLKALVFAKAIAEMRSIIKSNRGALGTIMGLAGVGDLYVTSRSGRNETLGYLLGKDMTCSEALNEMERQGRGVVEGYRTALLVKTFIKVSAPLFFSIHAVLKGEKNAADALREFLTKL